MNLLLVLLLAACGSKPDTAVAPAEAVDDAPAQVALTAEQLKAAAIGLETAGPAQIREVLPLYGVGPWTVDMLLIFSISRLDVWPVGDFAIRAGVRDLFGLKEVPGPKELETMAEPWRPYRSVAAWYIWRSRGFVPQSGVD